MWDELLASSMNRTLLVSIVILVACVGLAFNLSEVHQLKLFDLVPTVRTSTGSSSSSLDVVEFEGAANFNCKSISTLSTPQRKNDCGGLQSSN